jgi:hypothetical protein
MALIGVVVQDEKGNQIGERVDVLSSMFGNLDDTQFSCLRFVDPYGDTVFNRLQVQVVLQELRLLKQCCHSHELQDLIQRIEALAQLCQQETHLYLKFIGD